jgi:hypothetical protein
MSSTDEDTDAFELPGDDEAGAAGAPDMLFGVYSVLSPGVQIVLEGRAVSAPPAE